MTNKNTPIKVQKTYLKQRPEELTKDDIGNLKEIYLNSKDKQKKALQRL